MHFFDIEKEKLRKRVSKRDEKKKMNENLGYFWRTTGDEEEEDEECTDQKLHCAKFISNAIDDFYVNEFIYCH